MDMKCILNHHFPSTNSAFWKMSLLMITTLCPSDTPCPFNFFLKSASELDLHRICLSESWQDLGSLCIITQYYKKPTNYFFPLTPSPHAEALLFCVGPFYRWWKIPCLPPTTVLHPSLVHSCELFSTVMKSLDLSRLSECREPNCGMFTLYVSIKGALSSPSVGHEHRVEGPFCQWSAISDTDLAEN